MNPAQLRDVDSHIVWHPFTAMQAYGREQPPIIAAAEGFEVIDLDVVHARLAESNADVTAPKIHAEGFRELITADPDGNRIRLFSWPVGH